MYSSGISQTWSPSVWREIQLSF